MPNPLGAQAYAPIDCPLPLAVSSSTGCAGANGRVRAISGPVDGQKKKSAARPLSPKKNHYQPAALNGPPEEQLVFLA